MNTYSTWYPPVQQTLMCLSKLYRTVEHKVFAGLAQDAIAACTIAVQVSLDTHVVTGKQWLSLAPKAFFSESAPFVYQGQQLRREVPVGSAHPGSHAQPEAQMPQVHYDLPIA